MIPKVPLGKLAITPGALAAFAESGDPAATYLRRHATGDWGNLDDHDRRENEVSLVNGFRLLSAYTLTTGVRIWIITEADRSSTCILLPEEY